MWNLSGVLYRVWAVGGTIFLLGVACLLISKIGRKDFDKSSFGAGIFCTVVGVGAIIYYLFCGLNPQVSSAQGTLTETYHTGRVAPFTYEYIFYDADGFAGAFYLDSFTRKEMIPEGFVLNEDYTVYYEARTDVIVGVEKASP